MTTKPRRRTVAPVLLRTDTRGGHLVEYILLVGLIACLVMAAFRFLGRSAKVKAEAQGRCVASLACDDTSGAVQVAAVGDVDAVAADVAMMPRPVLDYMKQHGISVVATKSSPTSVG